MIPIDNSGKGNCLYYAYSISLMHYLRARRDDALSENIFDRLKLTEDDKGLLHYVINRDQPIDQDVIESIIEPVLGSATRNLTGDFTVEEFKSDLLEVPTSPFFAAAKYGLEYYFKQALQTNNSELAYLINNDFSIADLTEAEIYRTPGIPEAMQKYATERVAELIKKFNQGDANNVNLLDNILNEEAKRFFTINDYEHLEQYKTHLQREYVWGTEENLMTLHRAIQNERLVRLKDGSIKTIRDNEICLYLAREGELTSYQLGSPDMILNNYGSFHWTSIIPDKLFSPQLVVKTEKDITSTEEKDIQPIEEKVIKKQKAFKILDDMKVAQDNIPKSLREFYAVDILIRNLEKKITIFLDGSSSLAEKHKACEESIDLILHAKPKLGHYQSFGTLLLNFISAILDCIPHFLGGNDIRSGLETLGLYKSDKAPAISITLDKVHQVFERYKEKYNEAKNPELGESDLQDSSSMKMK